MNEEELEQDESVSVQTETQTSVETNTQSTPDSFPRIEDIRKSEQEVKVNTQIEGVTQVEQKTQTQDRVFTRKIDEKKVYLKKRLKIVTAVYTTVVALLLGFVITNVITQVKLDKSVSSKTETIDLYNKDIADAADKATSGKEIGDFTISLNEPRDYSEDKKELTFLDKLTILFRNIFG